MKKWIVILGIALLVVSFALYNRFSYADDIPYYSINKNNDKNILKIGIIGDSWVSKKRFDWEKNLKEKLQKNGINAEILTSSHPGATSKTIYQNLFEEKNQPYSSRFIIEAQPNYCIIFAGVNDAVKHITKEYYAEHYVKIIKTLLHYHIKPVVVELPSFGVEEATELKTIYQRYGVKIVEMIDTDGNSDNITEYRNTLQSELKNNKLLDKVIFLHHLAPEYHKNPELYSDYLHLNEKGYNVLLNNIYEGMKQNFQK